MEVINQLLKSRTVWYAIVIAILSVLQGFVFALPVPPMYQALIGCLIAIGIVLLRAITTQPLQQK